jgi:hypothetical protein
LDLSGYNPEVVMKILRSRTFWGTVFIAGGILLLLQSLEVFKGADLFWGLFFILVGGLFISAFWANRSQWWYIVPGVLFLGIGANSLSQAILPENISNTLGGLFILGSLGLGFWLVYLVSPGNWWAIIPGGVMTSLAIVSVLDQAYPDRDTGGLFLIGLGLTFALLAILPRLHMTWAYIPAVVLIIIGCVALASEFATISYIWPVLLILVGLFVLVREVGIFRR